MLLKEFNIFFFFFIRSRRISFSFEMHRLQCVETSFFGSTVEPLIAATFIAKVRWPLFGGGRYSEVYYKYGKAFGTEG